MTIRQHPDDSTLIAYTAGAVTEGFSLVVAAHLELCPSCRKRLSDLQALGGALLMAESAQQQPAGGLNDIWARIDLAEETQPEPAVGTIASDPVLPRVLLPLLGGGFDSIAWRRLAPGIGQHVFKDIESGEGSVRLLSIEPGITIPQHSHGGGELTLVLQGAYLDEIGTFRRGDMADLDDSVTHQPVADQGPSCVCLIATDRPLRFSSAFNRILQPIFGI
ncbi:MAG: ChrR family anti-sigma-E factor [Gammaproteobacteria bacterium]|nr:ChrR family anti-sigma-E factor [Gammaproteobacteria bacterium]